jgi:hypothetical protein
VFAKNQTKISLRRITTLILKLASKLETAGKRRGKQRFCLHNTTPSFSHHDTSAPSLANNADAAC